MDYESIKLENQLCFPLYAASKEVIRMYKPFLQDIGLTYTQYITMMILWEEKNINIKALGARLYLDSGTLTPLLKKLESDGLVIRTRLAEDERNLMITLSEKGKLLREKAVEIPQKIGSCIPLSHEEAIALYSLLYKVLAKA